VLLTTIRKQLTATNTRFTAVEGTASAVYFDSDAEVMRDAEARVIEGAALRAIDVSAGQMTEFTAFLDGIQRAGILANHDQSVPILYSYGAAVIRERDQRRMRTLRRGPEQFLSERWAVFFPSQHVAAEELGRVRELGWETVDTTPAGTEPLALFPPLLHARAKHFINNWRESIERDLALRWCEHATGWLLIDGSIAISPKVAACRNVVGLIKSHRTRLFDGADARVILKLRAGQRTSVFEPKTWQATPVRSWYLRVHDAAGHDSLWGLVRVEMAASHDPAMADVISQWLLAELRPVALPDARWDRLIYPIRDCEEFLRARIG
jgi:hypothetical protein